MHTKTNIKNWLYYVYIFNKFCVKKYVVNFLDIYLPSSGFVLSSTILYLDKNL